VLHGFFCCFFLGGGLWVFVDAIKKTKKVDMCGELFIVPRACGRFVEVFFFVGEGEI